MNSLPNKKVLISEAAKLLDVSIDTVRRWDKSGVLHSERIDGKNRYFSLKELEQHKLNQPLAISEAARELGISAVTLRRLEARGSLKPERNSAGERTYSRDSIENFSNSDYLLRKKSLNKKVSEPISEENKGINDTTDEIAIPRASLKPPIKKYNFIATSTIVFILLVTFSIRNIWIAEFKATNTPVVLSATQETKPEISPIEATSEAKPQTITVKTEQYQTVNIRQKASASSKKVSRAENGDTFELISKNSDWFEVKLASGSAGFISAEYAKESPND